MGIFDRLIKTEERTLENPNAPVSADDFLHIMGWGDFSSDAGVTVNVDNAPVVPAVWSWSPTKRNTCNSYQLYAVSRTSYASCTAKYRRYQD